MKKRFVFLGLIGLVSIIIGVIWFTTSRSPYQTIVSNFEKVTVADVRKFQDSDKEYLVYIGRETCPACVEFVPNLLEVKNKKDIPIYYLDSTESKTDEAFIEFKTEYGITSVPTLAFIKNGETITPTINNGNIEEIEKLVNVILKK